ncbi:hypothetical protein SAMN05421788_107158 [Filimonas lacunae]|uniref:Uncharacterized protein n=1 Tax=Filimonas lacunae TaxID=477680 RepID=A0A1N7QXI1_9BACT|nr:hypothetical protein SAMN05421788_107158 [Filimonas lacunae]
MKRIEECSFFFKKIDRKNLEFKIPVVTSQYQRRLYHLIIN